MLLQYLIPVTPALSYTLNLPHLIEVRTLFMLEFRIDYIWVFENDYVMPMSEYTPITIFPTIFHLRIYQWDKLLPLETGPKMFCKSNGVIQGLMFQTVDRLSPL